MTDPHLYIYKTFKFVLCFCVHFKFMQKTTTYISQIKPFLRYLSWYFYRKTINLWVRLVNSNFVKRLLGRGLGKCGIKPESKKHRGVERIEESKSIIRSCSCLPTSFKNIALVISVPVSYTYSYIVLVLKWRQNSSALNLNSDPTEVKLWQFLLFVNHIWLWVFERQDTRVF